MRMRMMMFGRSGDWLVWSWLDGLGWSFYNSTEGGNRLTVVFADVGV